MSLNKVMLIGNVGRDPEVRYLEGNQQNGQGTKVATFTLATTERFRDRNGELRENTEWHNIVAWRNSADVAERFIRKGTQLYIEGRLRTRSWTDQTGNKRYTTEISVDNLQLLGKRDNAEGGQGQYQAPASQGQPASQPYYQQNNAPAGFQPRQAPSQPAAAPVQSTPAGGFDINDGGSDDLPF